MLGECVLSFPFLSFPILSYKMSSSVSFLAGLMVKLHEGVVWSVEEVQALKVAAGLLQVHESRESRETRVIKKIKTVESQQNTPIPTQILAPPVEELVLDATPVEAKPVEVVAEVKPVVVVAEAKPVESYSPPKINPTYCIARKVSKDTIAGTDVFKMKQCPRLRVKGGVLCSKCTEFLEEWKKNPKKKSKWEGTLNEVPLDHLHVEGSKWFHEKYPTGLPSNPPTNILNEEAKEPQEECVLVDAPAKEVKWATLKHEGMNYIYNVRDRRVYKADITKEGEDQILWDSYEGKWRNGEIDPHYEENEEEVYDD